MPTTLDWRDAIIQPLQVQTARRALVKDQITAKTRLATATNPLVKDQLCRRIDDIDTDIKALMK